MPISRGSVNHDLSDDLISAASVLLNHACCSQPSDTSRAKAGDIVSAYFGSRNTEFFPYARTCFYATLKSLQIPAGSEVLMTPFNISPMLHIVNSLDLKPVFIDINLIDFGPAYAHLDEALSRKPACFLLTYLFGYVPNIQLIAELCNRYGVPLIEDISQSIGARQAGKLLGTFGTAAIYSASLTKYVDGYNGAFILTDNDELAESLRIFTKTLAAPRPKRLLGIVIKTAIWNIALNRYTFTLFTFPLLRIVKTVSRSTFNKVLGPSINVDWAARLPDYYFEDISDLQLKTIVSNLAALDRLLNARRSFAKKLFDAFEDSKSYCDNVSLPAIINDRLPTYWQFLARVDHTDSAQERLFDHGIETGITNLPDLANLCGVDLENARQLKSHYIFLPLHRHLRIVDYKKMLRPLRRAPNS